MYYRIIEEASEACVEYTSSFEEAVESAKKLTGKYLVLDESDNILYDTQPGISYKI